MKGCRPENQEEIAITPEMIEAGMAEFCDRDRWGEAEEEVVKRIFRAMVGVARHPGLVAHSADCPKAVPPK
jgi:hypothetical protein